MCYNYERLEEQKGQQDNRSESDKAAVSIGETPPAAPLEPSSNDPSQASVLKPNIGPTPPNNRADTGRPDDPQPQPIRMVNESIAVRITENNELSTFERKTLGWARLGFWIAGGTFAIAFITGWIFFRQLKEMSNQTDIQFRASAQARRDAKDAAIITSKQLEALQTQITAAQDGTKALQGQLSEARRSVAIAAQQLEATVRPWITEAAQISGSIVFNVNGANITFLFTLENIGHSPAEKVWIEALLTNMVASGMPSIDGYQRFCSGPATSNSNFTLGETLFPGKPLPSSWTWTIPWDQISGSRAPNIIGPILYGCIDYSYGVPSKRHFTPFRYDVVQLDGRLLVQDGGFNASTREIPASTLMLRRGGILGQPPPN